jgi:anti-sigma factor RsiW
MHQPIQEYLEEYLRDPGDRRISQEFHSHLSACDRCAGEIRALRFQTNLLRSLRVPADVEAEPAPGFYANVMARIEEERVQESFWSLLLESAFGRRLAYGCAALVLLMGTYLVSSEPGQQFGAPFADPSGLAVSQDRSSSVSDSVEPQQRDRVLVSLVSYRD